MSASLLRGLRILEMLAQEALGVSELARRLEVDKAGVSRNLTELRREGWVIRTGSLFVLGDRALRLGESGDPALLAAADGAVRRLAAASGLTAVALRLSGVGAQPVALHEGAGGPELTGALDRADHLALTAAGIALLAQLSDGEVAALLERHDFPAPGSGAPSSAADVLTEIARVVATGIAWEESWSAPGVCCVAAPWSLPAMTVPHVLTLVGRRDHVVGRRPELEGLLRGLSASPSR